MSAVPSLHQPIYWYFIGTLDPASHRSARLTSESYPRLLLLRDGFPVLNLATLFPCFLASLVAAPLINHSRSFLQPIFTLSECHKIRLLTYFDFLFPVPLVDETNVATLLPTCFSRCSCFLHLGLRKMESKKKHPTQTFFWTQINPKVRIYC